MHERSRTPSRTVYAAAAGGSPSQLLAPNHLLKIRTHSDTRTPHPTSTHPAVEISVNKEGVKFAASGDIGSANVICRQNTNSDKPEEQTIIDMNEPVRCVQ